MAASASPQNAAVQAYQQNMAIRNAVLLQSIEMTQQIGANTVATPVPGQQVIVPVRQVGAVKRFILEILMSVTVGAAETQTITQFGPANIISNVIFTDLANYQRINTTGWHLFMLACMRGRNFISPAVFGAAYTNDSPINAKSVFQVISAPASYTTAQVNAIRMFYEIPVTYSDTDLRGVIYAGVVSANAFVQFTLNQNFFQTNTGDATLSVYKSSTAQLGIITSWTWTLYQNYLDQVPMTAQGPLLPPQDMSTMYLLNNTAQSALVVNQDFPTQYSNWRHFMSTCVIFDNGGTLNAGSDINYWGLQTANLTFIWKIDPFYAALKVRNLMNDDFPLGTYYFSHREMNGGNGIYTTQFGNMQLVLNASTVNANANIQIGFEQLALVNQAIQAGSLAAS